MTMPPLRSAPEEIEAGVLAENPTHKADQDAVLAWAALKGRPSRPIDPNVTMRTQEEFARLLSKLPHGFFDPFNRLLEIVGLEPIRIAPRGDDVSRWNRTEFGQRLVEAITDHLDNQSTPRLIPYLVDAFVNLECERVPQLSEWASIDLILVPGSRTYDRAAEAHRAYRRSQGNAYIITSGRAPYYDPSNSEFELTESEANAAYLRLLGIPENRIVSEQQSMDTVENAEFLFVALKVVANRSGVMPRRLLLATSPFHLARYRLSVERLLEAARVEADVYAIGSRASRYWAETYFVTDTKSGYVREETMKVVLNEYLKIAFDLCAENRPAAAKPTAPRDDGIV